MSLKKATSSEFDRNGIHVIGLIDEWNKNGKIIKGTRKDLGGTMRLGLYEAKLKHNSMIKNIYKSNSIKERHRHRYEINNNYLPQLQEAGLVIGGLSEDRTLVETIELPEHPWFFASQFHPEFTSTPRDGHPLFSDFIKAAKAFSERREI